ncbi:MAG: NADH-quinone oxidoreductase subunit A [Pirellulales bacterium]
MATPTAIAAYLALFVVVGLLFLGVTLLVGRLLRPSNPNTEKLEVYECGEPAIGSSFVQFDLRFYVVALVFLVFDVEVAFLFPLATVFGKATHLLDTRVPLAVASADGEVKLSPAARGVYAELGVAAQLESQDVQQADVALRSGARQLAVATFWAIMVFFVVLLVGFAYEWKTGAFDWVRAVSQERRDRYLDTKPTNVLIESSPTITV